MNMHPKVHPSKILRVLTMPVGVVSLSVRTRLSWTSLRGFELVSVSDFNRIVGFRSLFGTNIVLQYKDNITQTTQEGPDDDDKSLPLPVEKYKQSRQESKKPEPEDFFGIPQNFRLQQIRLSDRDTLPRSRSKFASSSSVKTRLPFSDTETLVNCAVRSYAQQNETKNRRQKRRDRHKSVKENLNENPINLQESHLNNKDFVTSFGYITFDKNMSSDSLQKFSEKLSALNQPVKSPEPSISPDSHLSNGIKDGTSKEFDGNNNFLPENSPVPSYFDEVFFPGQIENQENKKKSHHDDINSRIDVSKSDISCQHMRNDVVSSDDCKNNSVTDINSHNQSHEYEKVDASLHNSEEVVSNNLFDEQYFGTVAEKETNGMNLNSESEYGKQISGSQPIEDQYFGNDMSSNSSQKLDDAASTLREKKMGFVDQQYFDIDNKTDSLSGGFGAIVSQYHGHSFQDPVTTDSKHVELESETDAVSSSDGSESVLSNVEFLQKKRRVKGASFPKANLETPTTAYDVAMKIRRDLKTGNENKYSKFDDIEKEPWDIKKEPWFAEKSDEMADIESKYPLDSKGFRLLQEQVMQWDNMTTREAVIRLKERIIFNHDDFLALDKPYGLPCVGQRNDKQNVTDLLPGLTECVQRQFKLSQLHLVQGLDRDVSGPLILAKSPEVASILRGLYNTEGEIIQRFWAITKGVPRPETGIIDIPIGEAKVGNIYKTVLRPLYSNQGKPLMKQTSEAPSYRAITEYRVLCSHQQAAVVECTPLTNNLKHQLRVHLANGVNAPILGDHKYSHFSKLAPQKLHREMLELLKIRQAKVRHLSLYLHCRSVVLTNYKGQMYFLTTRPPLHFKDNARRLKLIIPRQFMKRF